jgi:O-antigen ligase
MVSIYNFLKNAWKSLLEESRANLSFLLFLILMISIPLKLGISNVILVLFVISFFLNGLKTKFSFSFIFFLPILLFSWMAISYFWSIDSLSTINAIPKEITLLVLPLAFMFFSITETQKQKAIRVYSYAIVFFVLYYLFKAFVRFLITGDSNFFFYHGENCEDCGLVPKLLNAIHVSVFVAMAFFYFFTHEVKSKANIFFSALLFIFIVLLSSKNIILVVFLLTGIHLFYYSKIANKMRLRNLIVLLAILALVLSFGKIKQRFKSEFRQNTAKSLSHNVVKQSVEKIHNVSIYEAWNNKSFTPNDFFPGTAFRVYQTRLFFEFLSEEAILWKGFGLNASYKKLEDKGKLYNVFLGDEKHEGYQTKNFHNQYIQIFAELGLIGFILLIAILLINIKRAFKTKDFLHIAFAILMISVFLTESFLWRQRGIVFFTIFFCLFNQKRIKKYIKTT